MRITLDAFLARGKMRRMPLRIFAPRYWATWLGLALLRVFASLPFAVLLVIGRALGRTLHLILTRFQRTARRNMELCLPQLTPEERGFLIGRHFESLGVALFETALSWWASNERIRTLSTIEGREHLQAALAKGKGVILLSAHFTTLEMGARILAADMPLNIMYRPTKNECLSFFLARNRGKRAKRAIPRDDIRTLITALRNNECVWYAPDQSYRKKGAEMVRLFGIPAATNTATSRLAAMTGAAVLPYFAERLPGRGGYRAVIHPPLEGFPSGNAITDAEAFSRMIENQVRVVPEQYLWIHKRFKGLSEDYPDYYGQRAPRSA
jgi:Kdo2-lipid IVA lauroyltransferase/acyltransferase